jgi:lambda family phage portal protein
MHIYGPDGMTYSREYVQFLQKIVVSKQNIVTPDKPGYLEPGGYFGGFGYPGYNLLGAGTGSDGSKWPLGLSDSGQSPVLDHYFLRQNARSAYHDTPLAHALVSRYADTVVDVGLRLEATPKTDILGITPEQGEEWANRRNEEFDSWARSKKSIRDESMNFYQAQRLVEIFQQRDNDYFARLYYSKRKDLLNPLQIGFVDPNQIKGDGFTSTYGFQFDQADGIVRDSAGRERAYNVYVKQPDYTYKEILVPAMGASSKLRMMLHGYMPEYAGQGRGFSLLSHALQEFENLTDFTTAQIKKAISQSALSLYVKPSKDNPASDPFAGISQNVAGPPPSADPLTAPESTLAIEDYVRYIPLPEATIATPGTVGVFNLQEGEDINPIKDTAPSAQYDKFVEAFASHLAASRSIPIEVLLMKFNQNYSASRASLILFWRVAQIWRDELAADFLNPIYEMWLTGEIASGRVSAPGWSDPRLRAAWLCNTWYGAPMPNIDPQRTAEANKTMIEIGAQTLDRTAREHNGSSGKANRARLAKELGELSPVPWSKSSESNTSSKSDEDE